MVILWEVSDIEQNTRPLQRSGNKISKKEIIEAVKWPFSFILVLWIIEWWFETGHARPMHWGTMPRSMEGLTGIFASPFLHAGTDHLLSNTAPLLVVGTGLFHFYREIAVKVVVMVWVLTGFWAWLIGRQEYHIGASGLIYGMVVFLFFSGIFRKDVRLMAISMLVVFLYGSLAWGILPIDPTQSWETHLSGSLAGLFAAVYYRSKGPQRAPYQWELDETIESEAASAGSAIPEAEESETGTAKPQDSNEMKVIYHFKPNEPEKGS